MQYTKKYHDIGYNIVYQEEPNTDRVNIFIHGFSSITTPGDYNEFTRYIAPIPGTHIIFNWDAKDLLKGILSPFNLVGIVSLALPWRPEITIPAEIVWKLKALFTEAKSHAEQLAGYIPQFFADILQKFPQKNIIVFAHSLGVHLLLKGIASMNRPLPSCITLVLMGGATPHPTDKQLRCAKNCTIYNCYSPLDRSLMLKYICDGEDAIGRSPCDDVRAATIINKYYNFGHTDYWPNILKIYNAITACPQEYYKCSDEEQLEICNDDDLFRLLKAAEKEDLVLLAKILSQGSAPYIDEYCCDPILLTRALRYEGKIFLDSSEKYGVCYREIINAIAKHMNISFEGKIVCRKDNNIQKRIKSTQDLEQDIERKCIKRCLDVSRILDIFFINTLRNDIKNVLKAYSSLRKNSSDILLSAICLIAEIRKRSLLL